MVRRFFLVLMTGMLLSGCQGVALPSVNMLQLKQEHFEQYVFNKTFQSGSSYYYFTSDNRVVTIYTNIIIDEYNKFSGPAYEKANWDTEPFEFKGKKYADKICVRHHKELIEGTILNNRCRLIIKNGDNYYFNDLVGKPVLVSDGPDGIKTAYRKALKETGSDKLLADYNEFFGNDAVASAAFSEGQSAKGKYDTQIASQKQANRALAGLIVGGATKLWNDVSETCRKQPSACQGTPASPLSNSASATDKSETKPSSSALSTEGVKSIRENGNISNNPSYLITCASGRDKIVIRKENKWTDSLGATFSNSTWSLPLEAFAETICR